MSSNKKRDPKTRIQLLLLMLFITTIYLSTATYAWFSVNRVVYIAGLSIKVQAEGGIEISADGQNWKTVLSYLDIIDAHSNYSTSLNQLPLAMGPVSTGKKVTNGKLEIYHGHTENTMSSYILFANRSIEEEGHGEESEGNFIVFDFFMKSESVQNLYLTNLSGAKYRGTSPGIENSVRFAFLNEGTADLTASKDYIQSLNNATESTTYIWEPNYDVHTVHGISNASNVYGISLNETGNSRVPYDGIISEISKTDNITIGNANETNYPDKFRRVNVDYATKTDFDTNIELFSLPRGITKIRVYIWIEGQDVDCEDNSSVGDIDFDFQLSVNPA